MHCTVSFATFFFLQYFLLQQANSHTRTDTHLWFWNPCISLWYFEHYSEVLTSFKTSPSHKTNTLPITHVHNYTRVYLNILPDVNMGAKDTVTQFKETMDILISKFATRLLKLNVDEVEVKVRVRIPENCWRHNHCYSSSFLQLAWSSIGGFYQHEWEDLSEWAFYSLFVY